MPRTTESTIDSGWIYPDSEMTLDDIKRGPLAQPGMLVEFHDEYAEKDGKTAVLIGHVNLELGECNDCHLDYAAQVIRYRRVWVP